MDQNFFISIENENELGDLIIVGKFRVPVMSHGITVKGSKVLKHIVLLATRAGNYQSFTPFKDVVVFKDDVKDEGSICSGSFNIDLKNHLGFDGKGDYYCLCSLGTYLSNTVKISI